MTTPHYPLEGVVSWNMNTTCNYRCSYCTQRFVDDRAQWAKDLPAFIAGFAALTGDWEIKLSGGEPFRHPDFLTAVAALAAARRRVSVVTNLSASLDELIAFAEATAERPGLISASLHLEYVTAVDLLDKLLALRPHHQGSLCATVVATRENLPHISRYQSEYERAGIPLKIQPEKQDRDVIAYSAAESATLISLGGHNGTGHIAPNLAGRPCWAGARYFIVDHRGDAYRCYPSRRRKQEYLGNIIDGTLSLAAAAAPCRYDYCNCTVPQQRGMVETRS